MTQVRAARLLDREMNERARLMPKAQSVSLSAKPLSTASLTLMERSEAKVRDFIEAYTARGSAGVYRITAKESGYGAGGDVLRLEHGICVLGDAATPGEGEITGTYREVLAQLLAYQTATARGAPLWTLGDVEIPDTETVTHAYNGADTLNAILDVMDGVDGYAMTYDQSALPWVMHIRRLEDTPSCEGRMSRNVKTARVTLDTGELCTRVECSRLPGGYMQLEDNPEWGIVSRRLEFADEIDDAQVEAECRKYLEARQHPRVSVEMDALELSAITGEPMDRLDPGRMMRLALPDYALTVNERIVTVHYAEAVGRPLEVTVALSTAIRDASTSLASLRGNVDKLTSTATGYGNRIRESEKAITNLKDTDEGFKEIDGKILHWFSSVEVDLDATEEAARFGALASYKELSDTNLRITDAEMTLYGDGTTAGAGLVTRVTDNEADIEENAIRITDLSEAYVTLKSTTEESFAQMGTRIAVTEDELTVQSEALATLRADADGAVASLSARGDDNEASITETATSLGTRIDLKADKTYVETLVAEEIEAVRSDVYASIADVVTTDTLNVLGRANFTSGSIAYGGSTVSKTTLPIVTSFTQALGESAPTQEYTLLTVA